MEKDLFALLKLGLDTSTAENENPSDFTGLTADQWTHIRDLARKQGVLGIVLDGINSLEGFCEKLTGLSQHMKLEWIGEVMQIELRNRQQIAVMNDLAGIWVQNGCRVMVMKGQANGAFYPKPEHRTPGDIDCYLFEDYAVGNDFARAAGANVNESWYKHSVISYKGENFENHQYLANTRDGKRGKRLEKELEESLKVDASLFLPLTPMTILPPVQWSAMFLTYHACAHFVSEGLRLKQILDWAMFLKIHQNDVDWGAFFAFCDRNHLRVFADAMNEIVAKYLGVRIMFRVEGLEYGASPYADKIMHSALYDEDYVFNSGKRGWSNRLHLVKNMFHYRWKYKEIYQTSVWKQLWWYASGFLFKTE